MQRKDPQFYPIRKPDWENNVYKNDEGVSLAKNSNDFKKDQSVHTVMGRSTNHGAYGPHKRNGKIHYLGPHGPEAYFAYEIMAQLGIRTPKARVVSRKSTLTQASHTLATRSIDGYITMGEVRKTGGAYALDIKNQVMQDQKGHSYKISGNLFAADIVGILLGDTDFQSRTSNLGVKRVGNRFYAVAIDKEKASFSGKAFTELKSDPELSAITEDTLFQSRTLDQELYTVYKLSKALEGKNSPIDQIFLNSRVIQTPSLKTNNLVWLNKFKRSANSLIGYYKTKHGEDCLDRFVTREAIRLNIANIVIASLEINPKDKEALKEVIMEDLRGPYYENNENLVETVLSDIAKEFSLPLKSQHQQTQPVESQPAVEKSNKSRFWKWHDNLGVFGKILFWGVIAGGIAAAIVSGWGFAAGLGVAAAYGVIGTIFAKGAIGIAAGAAYSVGGAVAAGATAGGIMHKASKSSTAKTAVSLAVTPTQIPDEEKEQLISVESVEENSQIITNEVSYRKQH